MRSIGENERANEQRWVLKPSCSSGARDYDMSFCAKPVGPLASPDEGALRARMLANRTQDACVPDTYFFGFTKTASSIVRFCFTSVSLMMKCASSR